MSEAINSASCPTGHEIWADIPGFETYQVSTLGRIKSKAKTWVCGNGGIRVLPEFEPKYCLVFSSKGKNKTGSGYKKVTLQQNGKRKDVFIHRLVAQVFIPNLENKPYIDHINRDSQDNRVENLRWCTAKENNANRGGKYGRTRN